MDNFLNLTSMSRGKYYPTFIDMYYTFLTFLEKSDSVKLNDFRCCKEGCSIFKLNGGVVF